MRFSSVVGDANSITISKMLAFSRLFTIHKLLKIINLETCRKQFKCIVSVFCGQRPRSLFINAKRDCHYEYQYHYVKLSPHATGLTNFMTVIRYVYNSPSTRSLVLGIETSCDDTGAAVVDNKGNVLGESLNSQTDIHVQLGGIIPPIARDLHHKNIDRVVQHALEEAFVTVEDLAAVAVTNRPGLPLSLLVGLNYAKHLVQESRKPLIPIHHMEAHALTIRLTDRVMFPFLVLLMSGGHCLLALVRGVSDFLLLGHGLDDSPGDAFDKTARRLKLKNLSQFQGLSGGASIELAARDGDPKAFEFPLVRTRYQDCNFSFSGLKFHAQKIIEKEEARQDIKADAVLSNFADVCASFQYGILRTLARQLQRALLFCELKGYLPDHKTVVLSGGVASNKFLRQGLTRVCEMNSGVLVCPPPNLCTDNGVMIAWNGMEKLLTGGDLVFAENFHSIDIIPKCPLGRDVTDEVVRSMIKLSKLKLL